MMLILLLACSDDPADASGPQPVDVRMSEEDISSGIGATDIVWYGADTIIEPYEDKMMCIFGTYTGPDIGMHSFDAWQGENGHHFVLMGTTLDTQDFPDGMVVDCTGQNSFAMTDVDPLLLGTRSNLVTEMELPLPDGMAAKLRQDQRYILQSHYINTTDSPVRIRDLAVTQTMAEDQVQVWTAPMILNYDDMVIPVGESRTATFDCTIENDLHLLYLQGHMHEWGTAFSTDIVNGEELENLYTVSPWDASFRDLPPTNHYKEDELSLPAGTTLRTTCEWYNSADYELTFPNEMCDTVSMVYPSEVPIVCDGQMP